MTERLVISLILVIIGFAAYHLFVQSHKSRVASAAGQPRLLYFRSDRCAPCTAQSRYLEQLPVHVQQQVTIQKIDADQEREVAARYHVFTLPTTLLLDRTGSVRHINYGLTDVGKLTRQLENVL